MTSMRSKWSRRRRPGGRRLRKGRWGTGLVFTDHPVTGTSSLAGLPPTRSIGTIAQNLERGERRSQYLVLGAWYLVPPLSVGIADRPSVLPMLQINAIAKRFGTTVEAIGEVNAMTSNKIEAGATLQIPN